VLDLLCIIGHGEALEFGFASLPDYQPGKPIFGFEVDPSSSIRPIGRPEFKLARYAL